MKEIKYYHLRRNLTDEKPLDFVSLDNAYDFLVGFFTDKQAKLWHCDGIEDSAKPTPEEWVKAVMEEMGQIEFEIITGDDEHYDLWLSEKELRLADDGIAGAFKPEMQNTDYINFWGKMNCPGINEDFLNLYTPSECELLVKLGALFEEWNNVYKEYRKGKSELQNYEMIVPDGFYPNYLSQNPKILFVGRESYTIEGCNYIDLFIDHYLAGRTGYNNCHPINKDKFHKLLIQVAYGVIYGKDWDNTPYAADICHKGKIFEKISFAFMNLSKLSNNLERQDTTNTNWNLFDHAVNMSINCGRNFILDEIELLDPDLIITMNLERHRLKKVFGEMLEFEDNDWWKYKVKFPGKDKKCLLIDSWHFSSTKKDKEEIHDPILKIWQDFCAEKM